ncbi:Uncharacterised protein [Bordetella pertussis]|nr:Uncharacterised protein [Bordetella pertussis]
MRTSCQKFTSCRPVQIASASRRLASSTAPYRCSISRPTGLAERRQ